MSVHKIVGSIMHSSVLYVPRIVFGVNPQLSVILMTHDVQLPAMMCDYTNYT